MDRFSQMTLLPLMTLICTFIDLRYLLSGEYKTPDKYKTIKYWFSYQNIHNGVFILFFSNPDHLTMPAKMPCPPVLPLPIHIQVETGPQIISKEVPAPGFPINSELQPMGAM